MTVRFACVCLLFCLLCATRLNWSCMTCTALLQWWQHVVCDHEALPGVLMLAAGTFVAIISSVNSQVQLWMMPNSGLHRRPSCTVCQTNQHSLPLPLLKTDHMLGGEVWAVCQLNFGFGPCRSATQSVDLQTSTAGHPLRPFLESSSEPPHSTATTSKPPAMVTLKTACFKL